MPDNLVNPPIERPPTYRSTIQPAYTAPTYSKYSPAGRNEQLQIQKTRKEEERKEEEEDDGWVYNMCMALHCNAILSVVCFPCSRQPVTNIQPQYVADW